MTALSLRPLRLSLSGIKVSNASAVMSCQSDETTSLVVKRHYKNSEYIHYTLEIDKKIFSI